MTTPRISQRGPGSQKGGGKIVVRIRIVTTTSPPSPHVSDSLSELQFDPNLLQGTTWTRSPTTSVAPPDNPSPWPWSSHPSCWSTSRTFLVCVGCHLPPHQSQSAAGRRPETESHLTAGQSDLSDCFNTNLCQNNLFFPKRKINQHIINLLISRAYWFLIYCQRYFL